MGCSLVSERRLENEEECVCPNRFRSSCACQTPPHYLGFMRRISVVNERPFGGVT